MTERHQKHKSRKKRFFVFGGGLCIVRISPIQMIKKILQKFLVRKAQEYRQYGEIPIPHSIRREHLDELVNNCEASINILCKTVQEGTKPPAGAYAFFNHISHAHSRIQDIGKIIERIFNEVRSLVYLSMQEQKALSGQKSKHKKYPEQAKQAMIQSGKINGLAQLDMESLYIFGQTLLDQWSLIAIAVGNLPLKKIHPFVELVNYLNDNPSNSLDQIWKNRRAQMLWLHYQVRFYRNRFIVHANRPWQRGTTRTSLGETYSLFIPTPPGWLDDKKLDEEIMLLLPLTPPRIRGARADYWEKSHPGRIIEVLFEDIGNINKKEDREKIAELFGKKGGSTPTFQVIASNLLEFIHEGTIILNDIAKNNLSSVDLGKPSKTSDEMWKENI